MMEERRAQVRALFDEAAELPAGERCAFLDAVTPATSTRWPITRTAALD